MKHLLIIFTLLLSSISWSKDEKENIYLVCDGTIYYQDNTSYKETKSYHLKLNKYSKYNIYYDLYFEIDCEHSQTFFVCKSTDYLTEISQTDEVEIDRIGGTIKHRHEIISENENSSWIEQNNFIFKGKCEEKEEKLF